MPDSIEETSTIAEIDENPAIWRTHKRTAYIVDNQFTQNHAGRKGSALMIRRLTNVKIE